MDIGWVKFVILFLFVAVTQTRAKALIGFCQFKLIANVYASVGQTNVKLPQQQKLFLLL